MSTLADAILKEDMKSIRQCLSYGEDVNQIDEYGFTPLIEAAIVDNVEISEFLIANGATPNLQDVIGGTPLHWAAENNNLELCELLLEVNANPNAYNFAGQSVLVMPTLRRQTELKQILIRNGADPAFAQDYIQTKMLGHLFELVGTANIIDPANQFVEVDFEGYFLEVTLGLIAESVSQFQNHFALRQLRRYSGLAQKMVEVLDRASQLIKYQQYRVDTSKYELLINEYIEQEPLIIPVGYEGHAITFIRYEDIWVKCDRREDSRLYDNIMIYHVERPERLTTEFVKDLIYKKNSDRFINQEVDRILGLKPLTELKIEAQVSGNCSWANVEATIPALFYLMISANQESQTAGYNKTLALNFFHRWREWNKERALNFCIQSFKEGDAIRKACKAEILAAILFQHANPKNAAEADRFETILSVLINSPYEYILKNYVKVYYYQTGTEEGKRFFELLKSHGVKV